MGKYLIRTMKTGIKFDLKAGNGEVIATSECYNTEAGCRKGIESVRKYAPQALLEDQTQPDFASQKHPKFELYRDKAGQYRFRLKSANGRIIAVSESYKSWDSCRNGIDSVKKNAAAEEITVEA